MIRQPAATESSDVPFTSHSVVSTPAVSSEPMGDTANGTSEPGEIRDKEAAPVSPSAKEIGWGETVTTSEGARGSSWGSWEPSTNPPVPFVSAGW